MKWVRAKIRERGGAGEENGWSLGARGLGRGDKRGEVVEFRG